MTTPDILEYVESLDNESKSFKKQLYKMAWYMRGSLSADEIFQLGPDDREVILSIIEENLETTKESGLPFF